MKKLLFTFGLAAMSVMAADFTGFVMDQKCAGNKGMMGDKECAKSCIKAGSPAVLVTRDGKIYKIAEQDKVKQLAGENVMITGTLKGDTISVVSAKAM